MNELFFFSFFLTPFTLDNLLNANTPENIISLGGICNIYVILKFEWRGSEWICARTRVQIQNLPLTIWVANKWSCRFACI